MGVGLRDGKIWTKVMTDGTEVNIAVGKGSRFSWKSGRQTCHYTQCLPKILGNIDTTHKIVGMFEIPLKKILFL